MTAPSCPTATRLYENGKVIATDFGYDEIAGQLDEHPGAVLWLDLFDPDGDDLASVAKQFDLHPLAVEDAMTDHERPKLDRYPHHVFLNVYAVDLATKDSETRFGKTEISVFVTNRALITVRKSPSDTQRLIDRWDSDADLCSAGGVGFLLWGLLDVVVDGQYAVTQRLDAGMDMVEDALLEEGGAPRVVRMKAVKERKLLAALRRAVSPMPELVAQSMRSDLALVDDKLRPYFRDVEDHAQHTVDEIEHLRDRIDSLLEADNSEQSNVLNNTTRKLAAWAAIVAVPTAVTGYFGQNVPYPGYDQWWGFLVSSATIVVVSLLLYLYLKRRGWL
ncbi:magnesium transporter CorA family protein [Paractinoplanes bogorensis]|uniref:magnesium transporter CorA family protein n=1 Tax=Paractinoplanes bogorensis TaxID=1610840 RepID=UPI0027E0E551|nr:magnesium transporter CorA family protein [Actinoplanes bogorensis]